MKINDKNIPTKLIRQVGILLYGGKLTYDEIILWCEKFYPKLHLTIVDIQAIEDFIKKKK